MCNYTTLAPQDKQAILKLHHSTLDNYVMKILLRITVPGQAKNDKLYGLRRYKLSSLGILYGLEVILKDIKADQASNKIGEPPHIHNLSATFLNERFITYFKRRLAVGRFRPYVLERSSK